MKIRFCGATEGVTGSCHLLITDKANVLLDCGQFQGGKAQDRLNYREFPFEPSEIDCLVLSHAHIDHCGRIPLLVKRGFRGNIFCTKATADLLPIMLRDSGYIHEKEAEWANKKAERKGQPLVQPLYTVADAEESLRYVHPVLYDQLIEVSEGIHVCFNDAGHILGSAETELWVQEGDGETKIVFSGDLGVDHRPILRDPTIIRHADYVIMESTYGNRLHPENAMSIEKLVKVILRTVERGGTVVIPSFAVGRTQEMIYQLNMLYDENPEIYGKLKNVPVYIDSPLATEATRIFRDTDPDCFDAQTRALLEKGIDPINVPGLRISVTSDDSRMINTDRTPKVILSASGMCEAGRIRHHLKHNLWRPECTILFVGYQAVGTLGRTLIEGATTVKLFGEPIEVQAEICQLTGMSGHADRDGLLRWVNAFTEKPKRVFVMHGEDEVENIFVDTLTGQGFTACAPYNGAQWAIGAEGAVCLQEGTKVRIQHKVSEGQNRAATVFQRLVSAGKRLLRVIEHNEGGANKDLAKFADQINALCDKWDH